MVSAREDRKGLGVDKGGAAPRFTFLLRRPRRCRRRCLIARQRRHVNDGNDGAGEAKANGCIHCAKRFFVPDV